MNKMNYGEFTQEFVKSLVSKLAEQDTAVETNFTEVVKLNESYEALIVRPKGSLVGVSLPIEKFYASYKDGTPYSLVVDRAVETYIKGFKEKPEFNEDELHDYEKLREKLAIEVVSSEANKDLLLTIPHQTLEDMAVVYRFVLNSDEDGRASILVTNQILDHMGVTPEQLHADALENSPIIRPLVIKGMSEVMAEMMGAEQAEMMGIVPVAPEDEQMFVATVPDKVNGAGVLAYQDFMDQAAERAGGDFFILPSSIHEILIVPDNGKMNLKELETIVKEVNETQVAPADKLTDSVYHYDSKEKIFELGEKFVEHQMTA